MSQPLTVNLRVGLWGGGAYSKYQFLDAGVFGEGFFEEGVFQAESLNGWLNNITACFYEAGQPDAS